MKALNNQHGFTLMELITVIVIMAILAAVAVPKYFDLTDEAEAGACKANQGAIDAAASIYYAKSALAGGAASFPSKLSAMNTLFTNDKVPTCPASGTYTYSSSTGVVTCSINGHKR